MGDYIVNPMWFYWLHLVGELRELCFGIFIVYIIVVIIGFIYVLVEGDYMKDEAIEKIKRTAIKITIIAMIVLVIGIVIPSKGTMIEMEVAKHATYENIEMVEEKIKDATDYILEKMQEDE